MPMHTKQDTKRSPSTLSPFPPVHFFSFFMCNSYWSGLQRNYILTCTLITAGESERVWERGRECAWEVQNGKVMGSRQNRSEGERERERETAFCFTGLETGSLKLWFEDVRRWEWCWLCICTNDWTKCLLGHKDS